VNTEPFGFVGLGAMGGPMIEKAIEAGLTVHVFDTNQAALDSAANLGAKIEKSAAGVASAAEVVFVSLPNAPIVETVALGPDGVIEGTRIKHYIDLSTTGPTVAMKVGRAFQERGISALDCPVSGGPVGVKNKTLAVMSGGPKETLDRATPFLRSFTKTFVHVGPEVGKAQIVKLANNILMATNMLIVAEAMAFAEKGGVDPKDLFEVVNNGSGRSWVSEIAYPKHVLTRRYDQNFRIELMNKDVSLCLQEAEKLGVPMWLGAAVRQYWQFTMTQGMASQDSSRIAALVEQWAGIEPASNAAVTP
jgi:3-hydroxyisobutyrate dehydrogenase